MQAIFAAGLSPEKSEETSNARSKTPESCCPLTSSHQRSFPKLKAPILHAEIPNQNPTENKRRNRIKTGQAFTP